MANDPKRFKQGLVADPIDAGPNPGDDSTVSLEGHIYTYQDKIKAYVESARREVITADQDQEIINKTVGDDLPIKGTNVTINSEGTDATAQDAGITIDRDGNNGRIVYDSSTTSKFKIGDESVEVEIADVSSTQAFQGKQISGSENTLTNLDADEVIVDTISGLTAGDAQAAFAEHQTEIEQNASDISTGSGESADIRTTTGTSGGDTDMGTYTGSTITDNQTTKQNIQELETEVELKLDASEKGAVNGVAELDGGGKVPASQLPSTLMNYLGTWDASTNTPTLADGVGSAGDVYDCQVAGTVDLGSGNIDFIVGDWAVYNGTIWERSDNSDTVTSVQAMTGAVTLDTDDIPEGVTNEYYTEVKVSANTDVAANTAKVSADGPINTHSDVDTTTTTPSVGDNLTWDGSVWVPEAGGSGEGGVNYVKNGKAEEAAPDAQIFENTSLSITGGGGIPSYRTTTVVLSGSETVTSVVARLRNFGSYTGNWTMYIYGDTAGEPDETNVLGSATESAVVGSTFTDVEFSFSPVVALTAGTYHIGFPSAGNTNLAVETYGAGGGHQSFDSGSTWGTSDAIGMEVYAGSDVVSDVVSSNPSHLSVTRSTANAIDGDAHFNVEIKSTASVNDYVEWDLNGLAIAHRGNKPLFISNDYRTDANYSSGDCEWVLYNSDSAAEIPLSGIDSPGDVLSYNNGVATIKFNGVAYTQDIADDTYKLRLVVRSVPASDANIEIDNVGASPDVVVPGAIITAPVDFTPSFTNFTLGNGTVDQANWWREGSFMLGRIRVTLGSTSSMGTAPTITVPDGETIDSNHLTVSSDTPVGKGIYLDSGTQTYNGYTLANTSTTILFRALLASGTYVSQSEITSTLPMTWATGDVFDFDFKIPIEGWKASASLSTTEVNLQAINTHTKAVTPTGTLGAALNTVIFGTVDHDPSGLYNTSTGIWTAPRTGTIDVTAYLEMQHASSTGTAGVGVRNITTGKYIMAAEKPTAASTDAYPSTAGQLEVTKNDTVEIVSWTNHTTPTFTAGFTYSGFSISYKPDFTHFSVYGETETVSINGNTVAPGASNVIFDVSSMELTAGEWDIVAAARFRSTTTAPNDVTLMVSQYSGTTTTDHVGSVNDIFDSVTTTTSDTTITVPRYTVTLTGPTTIYLKARFATVNANSNVLSYGMSARKIK